jgi:hypothetical protein
MNAENEAMKRGQVLSDEQRRKIIQEITLQQQLNQLRETGTQVGVALGEAFFSIVNGANSARQALAGLLQSFVQLAQSKAIAQIGNLFGNFGASLAQGPNVNSGTAPATGGQQGP